MTTGMVLGKFLPPHLGHAYLVDFARHYVDELTVVVGTLAAEPIPGRRRYEWMREMFAGTGTRVVHLDQELPQDPSEHPEFWRLWEDALRPLIPQPLDYVFASEQYGWKLAEVLGAQFVQVDIDRSVMPVSGTKVREQPLAHWRYLPPCVQSYFVRRVSVFGPESTGKSTLAKDLAEHFHSIAVPEYARTLIESQQGRIEAEDIEKIARGQAASEDALARAANRVLFCDTDLLLTTIWSDWLFDGCPDAVSREARRRTYDLTLLTDVDVPWVEDQVRYLPQDRTNFFQRCETELQAHQRRYVVLRGSWEERFQSAVQAVDALLARTD
ncbi:Trifunctional NAD biosynthesis/regulator protein NadR [Stieleria neptunia]|uniref:Trifunctional NAD biosynthesis/regulator protein NadR n=1 Tax=Stieleria neptunia TaxID=2527979 RepID=A0A518I3E1_9BACT|nr:AAA family ATPase [Stieleria neptunia]QDV47615.1 Trifunctional NAD biosynthesis/regulator protein NadR [Stieleria neptunia]